MKSFGVTVCGSVKLMGFVEQDAVDGGLILLVFHNEGIRCGSYNSHIRNIVYIILQSTMIIMKSWSVAIVVSPAYVYTQKFISQAIWHRKKKHAINLAFSIALWTLFQSLRPLKCMCEGVLLVQLTIQYQPSECYTNALTLDTSTSLSAPHPHAIIPPLPIFQNFMSETVLVPYQG